MSSAVERLYRRVVNAVAIGRLNLVNDGGGTQSAQIQLSGLETRDGTPVMAHFGFSSVAPAGAIAVTIFGSGDRSKGVVVATGDAGTRPVGANAGETVVYNAFSMTITLAEAGITINGGGKPLKITNVPSIDLDTPVVQTTGNLVVGSGASGTFTTAAGNTVTVQDGIITNIM